MAHGLSSPLAPSIEGCVAAKRAQGYKYVSGERDLGRIDAFAVEVGWSSPALGRELVEAFIAPRPGERPGTTGLRQSSARTLGSWMVLHGLEAYVLPRTPPMRYSFEPTLLTEDEVRALLAAADSMAYRPQSPLRHVVLPALLRTLYACGMRIGEALSLEVRDVDLSRGVITVRDEVAKFNKGRLLPMSGALSERLAAYGEAMGTRGPTAPMFPSPRGLYRPQSVGDIFRSLLVAAGIPHTDDGPTLHSLRHSFACHRIMRWAREGTNVNAMLPFLASYLGHASLEGTERYLRLTAEMMPELREAVERLSWVIPGSGRERPS